MANMRDTRYRPVNDRGTILPALKAAANSLTGLMVSLIVL